MPHFYDRVTQIFNTPFFQQPDFQEAHDAISAQADGVDPSDDYRNRSNYIPMALPLWGGGQTQVVVSSTELAIEEVNRAITSLQEYANSFTPNEEGNFQGPQTTEALVRLGFLTRASRIRSAVRALAPLALRLNDQELDTTTAPHAIALSGHARQISVYADALFSTVRRLEINGCTVRFDEKLSSFVGSMRALHESIDAVQGEASHLTSAFELERGQVRQSQAQRAMAQVQDQGNRLQRAVNQVQLQEARLEGTAEQRAARRAENEVREQAERSAEAEPETPAAAPEESRAESVSEEDVRVSEPSQELVRQRTLLAELVGEEVSQRSSPAIEQLIERAQVAGPNHARDIGGWLQRQGIQEMSYEQARGFMQGRGDVNMLVVGETIGQTHLLLGDQVEYAPNPESVSPYVLETTHERLVNPRFFPGS
ncbi:MAG: hypothetical protein COS89_01275 [Deltaproteobacteria bacterium CG07_land_8_20_14_0_80_38_7]|nr:MAG: hypothetical protein COS89_01275 [Deltaproteobacteria bacterium CG07_land_8_20_14_0_80_38_7]